MDYKKKGLQIAAPFFIDETQSSKV